MPKPKVDSLPHSWQVSDWPAHVSPGTKSAGTRLVKRHRAELIACGALVRIGSKLTVLGEGYAIFLARKTSAVGSYEQPAGLRKGSEIGLN